MDLELSETTIETLATSLWARMVGSDYDPIEMNLRAKLALKQRLLGTTAVPFGLDKLSVAEVSKYTGIRAETLQNKGKRATLRMPEPYGLGTKLFWRRSELEAWIETKRAAPSEGAAL
jgi:predicted DNA-binding transcriptional regulator AlpA